MQNSLVVSLFCAFGFGIWPIIAGFSKLPFHWVTIIVGGISFIICIIYSFLTQQITTPQITPFMLCSLGGILNGIAFLFYGILIQREGIGATKYVAIIAALVPVVAIIGGVMILKNPINSKIILGISLIMVGVYLLNSK